MIVLFSIYILFHENVFVSADTSSFVYLGITTVPTWLNKWSYCYCLIFLLLEWIESIKSFWTNWRACISFNFYITAILKPFLFFSLINSQLSLTSSNLLSSSFASFIMTYGPSNNESRFPFIFDPKIFKHSSILGIWLITSCKPSLSCIVREASKS